MELLAGDEMEVGVLFVTVVHVNVSLLWDLRHCAFDLMNEGFAVCVCMLSFQTLFCKTL